MTMNIGLGFSTQKDPVRAAKEAARLASVHLHGDCASLGFVFSTVDLSCDTLLKTIVTSLNGSVPLIGCSGSALIYNEEILRQGLAIMLVSFPKSVQFNIASVKGLKTKTALAAGEELGKNLLYGFKDVPRDLSVIFSDGLMEDGTHLIYGLQERLGKSFPLAGASASDNLSFTKTYLYFNNEAFSDGACGILFGGKLNFGLGAKHGWKPLGKPRYVSKCQGNVVYEIDGLPAIKVYEEYFASDLAELRKKLKYISVLYPIGVYLAGEEEYLLRNLLSIREDGSLVFQGDVPENSMIRLMIGTKESCLTAAMAAAEEAQRGLSSRVGEFRKSEGGNFVLVFDSISRYILLRRDARRELKIIKETVGADTPVIGLYTYGEQAPLRAIGYHGQTYFHNQTVTIVAVGA